MPRLVPDSVTVNGRLRALLFTIPVVVVPFLPARVLLSAGFTANLLKHPGTCV